MLRIRDGRRPGFRYTGSTACGARHVETGGNPRVERSQQAATGRGGGV